MKLDRAEWTGTGAALLFHIVMIGALSMSLAHVASVPEPPAMDVEFVEDVGLTSAAPQTVATPPPASQAPEIGEGEPTEPVPVIQPKPMPSITPAKPRPATPAKPALKVARIGADFLKGIADDDLAPRAGSAKPAAPTFSATARASVASSIARQVQPCADRQPYLGDGADEVQIYVKLYLTRAGRLSRPPMVTSMSGPSDAKAKYGELLDDQVRRIFADCSPFRLPAELYDTDDGGWKETTLRYRVKK